MRTSILLTVLAASAAAQVANDHCAGAMMTTGAPISGSNVGATAGPDPLPACGTMTGDVWYWWIAPCSGVYTASTCAALTSFGTVVAVWDALSGCGALIPAACSDVCAAGAFTGASATFSALAGGLYIVSVGGNSGSSGTFELSITLGAGMALSFVSAGPGTLGYAVTEGPAGGAAFVAMTLTAGTFPLGWFYGIDIGWVELLNEISFGFPFLVPLQACGNAAVGPAAGLPSGLQVYAVGLGLPAGGAIPVAFTLPTVGVVP